jgi:cob(I)alamin adenosyltransferase
MPLQDRGYIQIYTGNGKGKTSAALGIAFKAAGAGLKTYIAQFMKEYPYSEQKSAAYISDCITIEQFGGDDFVLKKEPPSESDKQRIKEGIEKALDVMNRKRADIVILDEILVAAYFKLITENDILDIMGKKPEGVELILTGRYASDAVIEKADLVTEMKEIKHYFAQGVLSRKGIDA